MPAGTAAPDQPLLAALNTNWWAEIPSLNNTGAATISDSPFSIQLPASSLNQTSLFPVLAVQGSSTPYTNPALAIPGTIEMEYFDNGGEGLAYHDTSAGSHGQDYEQPPSYPVPSFRQPTDVDIYHSLDYSNSYLIVMQQGDWMKYTVDIAQSGTYTLEGQTFYWDSQGGTFHVEVDGLDKTGQIRIPGGTNVWQPVTKTGVQLTAGRHVLKVVCDSNGSDGYYMGDIDFLRFVASSQTSAHWKFDEGSGTTAADSSGNGNAGTLSGATWTTGKVGAGALSFNGTSDYLSVANNASLTGIVNNFTVSLWVNPSQSYTHEIDAEGTWGTSGVYNQRYLFGPYPYTDGTAGAGISIGSNGVSVYEHAGNYMPATLVYQAPIAGWTHVTLVYQNKQPRLYINGSLVRTGLTSPMAAVHINPLNLGGFSYGYYAGQVDDVRIYGSVLSGAEIESLATQADGGQTTYRASTDFSTTQGYHNWYYISDTSDTLMTYRSDYNVWEGAEGAYQWLWSNGGHPMYSHDAIRQWRAPSAGNIQITGSASDSNVGCGDGVSVSIKKNGAPLWQSNIANGDTTGQSYNLSLTVAAGDKINFIINKGSGNSVDCDSTTFDPTIVFTPSASSTYKASTDFSGTQGYRNWWYLDSTGAQLSFDAANNRWVSTSQPSLMIWNTGAHPDWSSDAVRQWQSPQAGNIRITGTAFDGHSGCGDGVVVSIRKGTQTLWTGSIADGSSTALSYDVMTSVALGDKINFVVQMGAASPFCDSTGFDPTIAFVTSTGPDAGTYADFAGARLNPINRTGTGGEDLLSGNYNWALPLLSLPGRAGLDLGLALSYNSLVWSRAGQSITYDADRGRPSPGFRLGFPTIQPSFYDSQTGKNTYLLITPSGARVGLRYARQEGAAAVYESNDSSYMKLTDYGDGHLLLQAPDGTRLTYNFDSVEYACTEIKDRNGNLLTITYLPNTDDISEVTDTLGRKLTFNYVLGNLVSITQARNSDPAHPLVTFGYLNPNLTIQTNFRDEQNQPLTLVGIQNGTLIPVINQVGLEDGSFYRFSYSTWGQVTRIEHHAADGHLRRYVSYNLPQDASAPLADCPRFTERREWAENWNGDQGGTPAANEEAVTSYSRLNIASDRQQVSVILPDGTLYKEVFATSGWQKGLGLGTETWAGGAKKKETITAWTQDDASLPYQKNPRVIKSDVKDFNGQGAAVNHRRTSIDYDHLNYASYGLPYAVKESRVSGEPGNETETVLRATFTDYNLGADYINNHIIGLVSARHVSDGATTLSKTVYGYDAGGEQFVPTTVGGSVVNATQHEADYHTSPLVRGNLTSVSRYNVTGPNITNEGLALTTLIGYDSNGSVVFSRDPLGHQTTISYADSFSDNINRNTFAYPTAVKDADNNFLYSQYNYGLGAVTRTEGPPVAGQTQGAVQTMEYDEAGRIQFVRTPFTGAWKFWAYPVRGDAVQNQLTVQADQPAANSITVFDGAGRVIGVGADLPNSTGLYSGRYTYYDVMGRMFKQSNPTEMTNVWIPAGDDAANGWLWSYQSYDWKGRPRVRVNPDETTTEASYEGCGCAGGEVVTLRDEVGRKKISYADALGRTVKLEEYGKDQNEQEYLYRTTTTLYNALDQVTRTRVYQGSAPSPEPSVEASGYRTTSMEYDGYGRLWKQKLPQQTQPTLYSYYGDDLVQSRTDARGVVATYSYNNRHLLTGIHFDPATEVAVTGDLSYSYDPAGNRASMTAAGVGTSTYHYDQLSRLAWEEHSFNDVQNRSFILSYGYNLAGQLTSMTDPFQSTISYSRDHTGRTTSVTAANFGSTPQFASDIRYRAWGAFKSLTYGSSLSLSLDYNRRLQLKSSHLSSGPNGLQTGMQKDYQYYADGTLRFAHDLFDDHFDRAYSYDEVGRIKAAYSGSEATDFINQTQTPSASGPYFQTYSYNVWGDITARQNRYWSNWESFGASYVDGKNTDPLWEYNADGTLKKDKDLKYKYDAAGNNIEVRQVNDSVINSQAADADGQVIKRVEQNVTASTTDTTYYVRSSALGGKVIAEVNLSGLKQKRNVYLGDEVLASEGVGGAITWKHEDALTGSQGVSVAGGGYSPVAEYDPSGVNVGLEAPSAGPLFEAETPTLIDSVGGAGAMRCTLDGLVMDCGWVRQLEDSGAAAQCPNNDCGPRSVTVNITYADGRRVSHTELVNNPFFNVNVTYRGAAARAAAQQFNMGMAEGGGGFGSALEWSLIAGEMVSGRPLGERANHFMPQGPVPQPAPTPTPTPGPCDGRSSKDLNYDRLFRREDGSYENGRDHITRRHILLDDRKTILTQSRLPLSNQSASKFIFQDNIQTLEQAQQSVGAAIAYVFDGAVAQHAGYVDRGNIVISGFIDPRLEIRDTFLILRLGVGYIQGRTMFGPSNTLTLILDKNCRDVITAHPGKPYNRR